MPITINGSGTVTGISAGGLPDDSIIAADIAAGAVTTAKVADANITAAKLSTGAPSWTSGGDLSFNSGYGSVATAYGCRAWVNFNGSGAVAIRANGNVSSITDNGTGDYTVNFTTAMQDASYSAQVFSGRPGGDSNSFNGENTSARTSSSFRFTTGRDQDSNVHDVDICSVAVFR